MKRNILKTGILLSGLLAALAGPVRAGTNDLISGLQKGLFEEEANHNLPAAIAAYQSAIAHFDKDRQLAATAVFRLGECYRKLGNTNEATAQYARIVREFPDQASLVGLSRQHLPASSLPTGPVNPAGTWSLTVLPDAVAAMASGGATAAGTTHPATTVSPAASTAEEAEEIARIQEMVKNSPDPIDAASNDERSGGRTPLTRAAGQGQVRVAEYLLQHGADPNKRDAHSFTPLLTAAASGHLAMVELLLRHGATVNEAGNAGWTPLREAARAGYKKVVEALLAAKADVNAQDRIGETPLHLAARHGLKSVVEALLAAEADVNARNARGDTPLHLAAAYGGAAMVELLLAHKAAVDVKNSSSQRIDPNAHDLEVRTAGATPLIYAILSQHADIAKLLVAAKADVNIACRASPDLDANPPPMSGSALYFAVSVGSAEMVALLLDAGANPDTQMSETGTDNSGWSPLYLAVAQRKPDIARMLLAHKADPNLAEAHGYVPLDQAVWTGSAEMVKPLLANHAKVDQQDQGGRTPLSYAAERGDTSIATALLEAKADPNLRDQRGRTALSLAVRQAPVASRKAMVELLLAKGAEPNTRDLEGSTPLGTAAGLAHQANIAQGPQRVRRPSAGEHPAQAPTPEQAALSEVVELLRKHGAVENLPRLDGIIVQRPGGESSSLVVLKGAKDYNHFTLYEILAIHYGFLAGSSQAGTLIYHWRQPRWVCESSLSFPDLNRLGIRRPTADGLSWNMVGVNVLGGLGADDCRGDVALHWGDVVEIPETDHPLNAVWPGLPEQLVAKLHHCVDRQVQLTVKGQTTNLLLRLQAGAFNETTFDLNRKRATPPSFALWGVLQNSGLLRASSDLSRVKVKRAGSQAQAQELTLDCSSASSPGVDFWLRDGDFWLRDGDVVEVPERQAASNALGSQ